MRIDALLCRNMSGSFVLVFPTLYEDAILLIPIRNKERKLGSAAARLHFRWSTQCFFFQRRWTQGPTRGGRPSCNTNVQSLDDDGRAYGKDLASENGAAKPPTKKKRACFQLSRSS